MIAVATEEERKAIAAFKRLAKKWPKTLWLFSGSGTLNVMQKRDGERVMTSDGGVDPDFSLSVIDIENDGGDW